ncbi:hypothetical protein [Sphingobacterium sp. E70]|uniref:hypothetical protein n=1 Tax=Sphingobacterium sp. E70 TaxID=2853439 RepID=UPI0027953296|nr:hypothetical protein [Sphingobacterium sp. E70]
MQQVLQINSDEVLFVDENQIPNAIVPVEGTPFDFRTPKRLRRISQKMMSSSSRPKATIIVMSIINQSRSPVQRSIQKTQEYS